MMLELSNRSEFEANMPPLVGTRHSAAESSSLAIFTPAGTGPCSVMRSPLMGRTRAPPTAQARGLPLPTCCVRVRACVCVCVCVWCVCGVCVARGWWIYAEHVFEKREDETE